MAYVLSGGGGPGDLSLDNTCLREACDAMLCNIVVSWRVLHNMADISVCDLICCYLSEIATTNVINLSGYVFNVGYMSRLNLTASGCLDSSSHLSRSAVSLNQFRFCFAILRQISRSQ